MGAMPAARASRAVVPVRHDLATLLPAGGLRKGTTVVLDGSTALLLTLLATATTRGSWAAVVGMPELGVLAAREIGVAPHRLALVPHPGRDLVPVTAALIDGMDLVAVVADGLLRDGARGQTMARRLAARARERGAVLIPVASANSWPAADVTVSDSDQRWTGIGAGHGRLTEREAVVTVCGRGAASRPTHARLVLQRATTSNGDAASDQPPDVQPLFVHQRFDATRQRAVVVPR